MPQPRYNLDEAAESKQITPEMEELYSKDIAAFLENEYYLENGELIKLEPWQKRILTSVFKRRKYTKSERQYQLVLLMLPKKNGKTSILAGLALWALFFDKDNESPLEVYCLAADKDQAAILYRKVTRALEQNSALFSRVYITRNKIERIDKKGFLELLSADAPSAHGKNASFCAWDELHALPDDRLWSAMTFSPTRKNPMQFCISYAGHSMDSLLYKLYEMGKEGKNKRMYFKHSSKQLASWVSDDYLEQQRKLLHPSIFAQMHEARFVSDAGNFLDSADVDAAVDKEWVPQSKLDPQYFYITGVDLGIKNDRTVITTVHYDFESQKVVVDEVQAFQGSREQPLALKVVEDYLADVWERYRSNFYADPWQAYSLIQTIKDLGIPIEEHSFAGSGATRIASNLFFLFKNKRITLFEHNQDMIAELKTVIAVPSAGGIKTDHVSGKHNDYTTALALASFYAVQQKKPTTPEVWVYSPATGEDSDDDDFNFF